MRHGSLFSGIGGFDLAAEWMGWENVFHCEWNPFGQKVLKHYWPNAISYHDITKTDFTIHRGTIDILTGGFPCQPYSSAGKRKGKEDERHLWPEMLRTIREVQPRWVVGENVFGLVNWSGGLVFHEVQADLEAAGYEVFPYVLPAVSVNAPHRRDRIWFVAYANLCRNNTTERSKNGIWEQQDKEQSGNRGAMQINGLSNERTAANANRNGFNGSDCQHEINASEGGEYAQRDFEQMGGDAADTDSRGLERAAEVGRNGKYVERQNGNTSQIWNANNPNSTSEQGQHIGQSGQREFDRSDSRITINDWQNFPTVSPICTGDDGISNRLDGITFPKWRNESIKAGGNAVVPQVVYQIFKAIEQYGIQNSSQHKGAL